MSKTKKRHRGVTAKASATTGAVDWLGLTGKIIALSALAFPMYFASRQLAHLGGNALWLPPELRGWVNAAGTALGLLVFEYVRIRHSHHREEAASATLASTPPSDVGESRNVLKGIGCLLLATLLFMAYFGLRYTCVFYWTDAQEWIRANVTNVAKSNADDPTTRASVHVDRLSHQESLSAVPPFIDGERSEILVPAGLFRPPCLREYLEQVAADPENDGLAHPVVQVLAREPDVIIDCLTGEGRMYLYLQILPFLVLYVLILASLGAAIGFPFRSGQAIGELLATKGH